MAPKVDEMVLTAREVKHRWHLIGTINLESIPMSISLHDPLGTNRV